MIELKLPSPEHELSFHVGYSQIASDSERLAWYYCGESRFTEFRNLPFEQYVKRLLHLNEHPPEDFVKGIVWWAFEDQNMVGRISMRLELNDWLQIAGGHIGYIVAPQYRGRGVATEMLRQVLETPEARSIGNLLVTCDADNIASERTICKNGGLLENIVNLPNSSKQKKRFWINL
jgi:predicted acetyltransferase